MRIVTGPVRMGRLQKFTGQRWIGTLLGPAERQEPIVFHRRVASNKTGREISVGIMDELLENLNLILSRDGLSGLIGVMQLIGLTRNRGCVRAPLEKFRRQRLVVFIHY